MHDHFLSLLDNSTYILTANRRLASHLHRQYVHYRQSLGDSTWQTPKILPLTTWLLQRWEYEEKEQYLLNEHQERYLWKKISKQAWSSIPLIQQAWDNLQLWDLSLSALENQHNDNIDAFLKWATAVKNTCKEKHWVTNAEIPALLNKTKNLPKACLLLGFDDLPPAITNFFNRIHNYCQIKKITSNNIANTIHRLTLENTETEIHTMACWAQEQITQNPKQSIGCIIPNLSQVRRPVQRIFTEVFSIENILPGMQQKQTHFNISATGPLSEFPIIQMAITVLQLAHQDSKIIPWEQFLQSPYLALNDTDIDAGALADEKRRVKLEIDFSFVSLLPIFTQLHGKFPDSTWLKRWRQLINFLKISTKRQTLQEWSNIFIDLLKTLGWPGYRTNNSTEHQIISRFKKSLEEFSQCDLSTDTLPLTKALNTFIHQLNNTQFQPEGSNTPIQILGILEAADIHFDQLWVMGLHDGVWPAPAVPNPFIPHQLQVENNMPHASAARELAFAKKEMNRLLRSAKNIIFSTPSEEDDKKLKSSRFINKYPEIHLSLNNQSDYVEIIKNSADLEIILDDTAPKLSEQELIRGGTQILKNQAICPFSAFARIRLNAQSPQKTSIGISALDKGKLLHRVLELVWISLKNQVNLLKLSSEELHTHIEIAINKAITETKKSEQSPAYQQFLELEQQRLFEIVEEWLSIEKMRPSFSVQEHESKRQVTIGGLSLNLTIDRIDKLGDGRQIIIDYKTGLTTPMHWFSDRPPDPQLPLYCTYGNTDVTQYSGIAYAQVRAGKMTFKGITEESDTESPADGIKPINQYKNLDGIHTWENMLSHWKINLDQLSQDFCNGDASIDPLETACNFCELQPLCRVQEK